MRQQNKLDTIDGRTLMDRPLEPPNFVVDTLIAQGLHILAGSPKVGKSWLALWLAVTVAKGQQTCREAGAFQQWTKKQSDDPVFKAYRKEYKKRFAWIKAGRISDTDFYAWSEQAREMKKKCDRDIITLEEYVEWLKHS